MWGQWPAAESQSPLTTGSPPAEVWLHPSPRLALVRRVEVAAITVSAAFVVVVVIAAEALSGGRGIVPSGPLLLVAVLAVGVLADRLAQRRVRAWAYREREDDLLVQRGVWIKRLSVVPYGRMQFIDVISGPVERVFGLATVHMHTAAAASDARIPGLSQDEAARLRDRLAQLGESRAAGL